METTIGAKITAVTVFPDRARVTAVGELHLEVGNHRLIVDDLPMVMERDSVRVQGRGSAQVRLLSVDVRHAFYERAPAAKVWELEQQIEGLEDELRSMTDDRDVLAAQSKHLDGLRDATEQYARGLARGKSTVEDQLRLAQFLREQDEETRAAMRALDKSQRELGRRLDKLRQELTQIQSARPRQRYQAHIEVEALSAGDFSLELTYVVNKAEWKPLYDLRLVESDAGPELELTAIAQVSQNTGQDWTGVELALSTARPALNQRLPELKPWYVDVYRPPPPLQRPAPQAARTAVAAPLLHDASVDADATQVVAVPATMYEAEAAVATVRESGAAVTFSVGGQSDVPSDGSPHKTTIGHFGLDPQIDYLTVPKHTDSVFRRIKTINGSPGPLLAGPTSLFVGDKYIGSSSLEYVPVGEEVELLMGVEERVTVERELTQREVDKALLRDKRQLTFGYKIELHNLLSAEAHVEVHDNIPVARHEDIKIKLDRVAPEPAERADLNLMEWRLTMPPESQQVISYEFKVEHPRSLRIVGLVE